MASKDKIKLYHTRNFNSARCVWLIEELEVQDDFEIIEYNPYAASESEAASYRSQVNFHGTVPGLVLTDGTVMVEGVAINLYLADKYKFLPPQDKRPEYYSWSVYAAATLDPAFKALFVQLSYTEETKRSDYIINNAKTRWSQFAERFEKFIENKQFICGDRFSAADINLGFVLHWYMEIENGSMFEGYPSIKSYLDRLRSRPSFGKAVVTSGEAVLPNIYNPTLKYVFT